MKIILALAAGTLLIAAAPQKITPAPADDKPAQPIGAAARVKNGPEPLAKPAENVGMSEDPAPITMPPTPAPQPK